VSWRESLLGFMRVPPEPTPPPGSPPRVFRAAPNYFTYKAITFVLTQIAAIAGVAFAIYWTTWLDRVEMPGWALKLIFLGEAFAVLAVIARMIFGWAILRLDFELRWYLLSDRAIRIREGIATVREKTIALANIQNISIQQGPLQRLLGIADLEVRTAGGGSDEQHGKKKPGIEPLHVAYFRGIDNAPELRDLLRDAVRLHRNTGLGDPDEPSHQEEPDDVYGAAMGLLEEARLLRAAVRG
jgi:membrane protein YdbS with pleckstrin-like domain